MPYFRAEPHEYVVHFAGGKRRHEGRAQSFWFFGLNSTLAVVPMNIQDAPFVFSDTTSDYQSVTYQGQASFRFTDPLKAVETLNLAVHPRTKAPLSNDLDLLRQRVTSWVNSAASAEIQSRNLITNIRNFEEISQAVYGRIAANPTLAENGIEIVNLVITSIRPTPEVAKAMEAELRESLMRKADEAIYARRTAAVEEERKIKEQEMATELAMEQRRQELIALTSQNQLAEAEARGQAMAAESTYELEKLRKELDLWKSIDAPHVAALGFKKLGESGAQQVVITSEVLSALLQTKGK